MQKLILSVIIPLLSLTAINTSHSQMMGPGMMMDESHTPMMRHDYGEGMMGHGPYMEGRGMGRCASWFSIIDDLNLSENQIEKINAIRHSYSKEGVMLRAKLQVAEMEFHELMNDDEADLKKIENKIKEVSALKEELMLNTSRTSISARKVLTTDQRKEARELMKKQYAQCPYHGGPKMMPWGWHETR